MRTQKTNIRADKKCADNTLQVNHGGKINTFQTLSNHIDHAHVSLSHSLCVEHGLHFCVRNIRPAIFQTVL